MHTHTESDVRYVLVLTLPGGIKKVFATGQTRVFLASPIAEPGSVVEADVFVMPVTPMAAGNLHATIRSSWMTEDAVNLLVQRRGYELHRGT